MDIRQTIWAVIREILQTALVSLAIFLFVYVFLVQPHRVKGGSMLSNFSDGELLLTEKVSYYFSKPARGDVIVFEAPNAHKVDFIKRIVGLPGETISIENDSVKINGHKLSENYTNSPTQGNLKITLDQNQYFVLGDNRNASSDSRSFGPINKSSFRGRSWLVYWPIIKTESSMGVRLVSRVNYSVPDTLNDF